MILNGCPETVISSTDQPALSMEFNGATVSFSSEYTVFPGFCDVHVHFREPGFSYKETIATGSKAAARGGYTAVCTMPNLSPVPDSPKHLQAQLDLIRQDSVIDIIPYASITKGQQGLELSDMEGMKDQVAGYSDDGKGIQTPELMQKAMETAKSLGKIIVAHCEDNSLLHGGVIHDGIYAATHQIPGICSESEWGPIARDLELAAKTGAAYHVCHISCRESVELIRQAKKSGVDVSCETAPHYLLLDEGNLQDQGRFKMNPPIRSSADREALVEGVCDGTIDMIATDHAPHSVEEKSRGLLKSPFGIVGIETAFPLLYTYLVRTGILSMNQLMNRLVYAPRKRFSLPLRSNDYTVWKLEEQSIIDSKDFLSRGKSTPFEGQGIYGKCYLTVCNGKIAYALPEIYTSGTFDAENSDTKIH